MYVACCSNNIAVAVAPLLRNFSSGSGSSTTLQTGSSRVNNPACFTPDLENVLFQI